MRRALISAPIFATLLTATLWASGAGVWLVLASVFLSAPLYMLVAYAFSLALDCGEGTEGSARDTFSTRGLGKSPSPCVTDLRR